MKVKIVILLIFSTLTTFSQSDKRISFEQSLEKAKTEHKNILLYFSGSDWCAPCVKFKKHFIETESFKSFGNENLVLFNADFPRSKKNKQADDIVLENEALAEKYNNKGIFPLILLLNENGTILRKWEQYPTENLEEFIQKMKG